MPFFMSWMMPSSNSWPRTMCSISQTYPMQKRSCSCSGQLKQLKEVGCRLIIQTDAYCLLFNALTENELHWQKMKGEYEQKQREREMWPTYIKGAQNCTHTKNNNVITHLLIHYVVVSSVFIFFIFLHLRDCCVIFLLLTVHFGS